MWIRGFTITLVLAALLSIGCVPSEPAIDPDLQQLERVARHLTSTRHLNRSAYTVARDKGTPSELVSFLFSDLGVAEWPAVDDEDEMTREQMRATNTPMFPSGAALVHARADSRLRKQLVLRGDDATGEVVAEAYMTPNEPPVATRRWPIPRSR